MTSAATTEVSTRIGIISDTHGLLRPAAVERLACVQHIIHAGDIGSPNIIDRLRNVAQVTAIKGNIDTAEWAAAYPESTTVWIAGRSIHVLHDLSALGIEPALGGFDIVIFGHSHRPKIETIDGVLYINPGSAGPRRFRLPVTLATVDLASDAVQPQIHQLVL